LAVKRAVDVGTAAIGLIFLGPAISVVALAIRCHMGSPVFFRQVRPGLFGAPFTLVKFRTMTDSRSPAGDRLSDAERLTRLGRFLRRTSLDELPQLWNVLRGDLSLVGPRPLLMRYLPRYTPFQMRRHEVKPGITGWAQVNGRNAITWEEKFDLDVWYVDNWSLRLDLKIILVTVARVLSGHGVSQAGKSTVDEFFGNSGSGSHRAGAGT
jgi:sugar transferase EpsL